MVLLTQEGTLYLEEATSLSSHPWISWWPQFPDLWSESRFLDICGLLGGE